MVPAITDMHLTFTKYIYYILLPPSVQTCPNLQQHILYIRQFRRVELPSPSTLNSPEGVQQSFSFMCSPSGVEPPIRTIHKNLFISKNLKILMCFSLAKYKQTQNGITPSSYDQKNDRKSNIRLVFLNNDISILDIVWQDHLKSALLMESYI